jgi:CBS-domain-containing membrane protein
MTHTEWEAAMNKPSERRLFWEKTARDFMTASPQSIRADALVREAVAFLADKGFHAAPVIDGAGRPVGVVSQSDIVVHDRENPVRHDIPDYYHRADLGKRPDEMPEGFQVEEVDRTTVRDIMTPVVFHVQPDAPAGHIIAEMVALRVHRLFVVDAAGTLVGVISALDLLRHLHQDLPSQPVPVAAKR